MDLHSQALLDVRACLTRVAITSKVFHRSWNDTQRFTDASLLNNDQGLVSAAYFARLWAETFTKADSTVSGCATERGELNFVDGLVAVTAHSEVIVLLYSTTACHLGAWAHISL